MSLPLHELQDTLLALFSGRPCPSVSLDAQDWQGIMEMAREHRLGPSLHWRLGREHAGLPVPATIGAELAAGSRACILRSLVLQRELVRAHRILAQAGIPAVALKGAYLAFHAYPNPALRPLRDLDLLVPEAQAVAAYEALLEGGCRPLKGDGGDLQFYLRERNHLPALRSVSGQVVIELHVRLSHHGQAEGAAIDLANDPGFWQRLERRDLAGETLLYPSPTDLLLHLATHAVYHHTFNNGPLILSDVAFLLSGHEIDWPLFWRLAERGGWTRGSMLVLAMTEKLFGRQPVDWPDPDGPVPDIPGELVATASRLCLRQFSVRQEVRLATLMSGSRPLRTKLGCLVRTCFPSREHMEQLFGAPPGSPAVVFYYAYRLVKRSTQYAAARLNPAFSGETRQIDTLERWLG